jgi:hypothetical protein
LVFVLVLLVLPTLVLAEENWTLTTADFQSQRVDLQAISDNDITVAGDSAAAAARHIGFDKLLLLQRIDKPAPVAAGAFIVNLTGRDAVSGQPVGLEGENLLWMNPALGKLSLPLKSVTSLHRSSATESAVPAAPQTEDVVTLVNGDSVRGIIVGFDATTVTIQQASGDKTPAPLDSVSRITFASTGAAGASARARGFRIVLADGTALTASNVRLEPANSSRNLTFAPLIDPTSSRNVPLATVVSIEQVNGPVVWLSSLTPLQSVQTSMFDLDWPARMDRAVDGSPIRFADRTFSRGIGVHSYSKLVFAIDPSSKTFRTQYAIAGDGQYSNVTVRVKLDDKVVHEQQDFRAGILAPPLVIDVTGKKQLILEVDYGQNYDVQDRFNWIEAAFLR